MTSHDPAVPARCDACARHHESSDQRPDEVAAQQAAAQAAWREAAPEVERHLGQMLAEFGDVFAGEEADAESIGARLAGLATRDPARFAKLQDMERTVRSAVAAGRTRAMHAAAAARDEAAGLLLRRLVPDWSDPRRVQSEVGDIKDYLVRQGFDAEAVGALDDPYDIAMARKAMLYDRMLAETRARLPQAPVAEAFVPMDPGLGELKARLARSGRLEDAAALIERLLPE